jgi:hypothetical protein
METKNKARRSVVSLNSLRAAIWRCMEPQAQPRGLLPLNPRVIADSAHVLAEILDADDDLDDNEVFVSPEVRTAQARLKRAARKWVLNPTPPGQRRPAGTGRRQQRALQYRPPHDDVPDYHMLTGLSPALFERIYDMMLPHLEQPRVTAAGAKRRYIMRTWTPMTRLLMVLTFIRHNSTMRELASQFGGSPSSVSRELWDLIPRLYVRLLGFIRFPDEPPEPLFEHASAAIDCTCHLRWRVHPWSCEWYRGDVHEHFVAAQLICDLRGTIYDVQLGQGHNNDRGMYNMTNTEERLAQHDIAALGDAGYTGSDQLIVPRDLPPHSELRRRHARLRSVVEHNFALVHMFKTAGGVFRGPPEQQQMVLMIVYALVYLKSEQNPLRPDLQ